MTTETIDICESCRQRVYIEDAGVVKAAEMRDVTAFGSEQREYVEGLTVFFHEHCYPHGSRQYKRLAEGSGYGRSGSL